jgi:hypothetical protein
MATRRTAAKAATKAAPAAKKAPAKKAAAPKAEKPTRIVGYATMDTKSAEFKQIPQRQQDWIKKCQEEGWTAAMKNVHRILEHNHGLFFISTTTGKFQVGTLSSTGKSFNVAFESEDRAEALEVYRTERSGNYGGEKAEPAPKKAAAKKAPAKKATPKRRGKAAPVEDDEDIDDLLD